MGLRGECVAGVVFPGGLLYVTADHNWLPATQGAGGRLLGIERLHRSIQPREGNLEQYTSQDRFWFCQRSLCNDKSESPGFSTVEYRLSRTKWST